MSTDAKRPSELLAGQVKMWRRRRGLTAAQLAGRVADIGGKLDRVAIAKIETNARGVSLDEAVQLAYALTVSPLQLFLPLGGVDAVAVAPNVVLHPHLAWKWAIGEEGPANSKRLAVRLDEWHAAAEPIRLYRVLDTAQQAFSHADTDLSFAERSGNAERIAAARETYADAMRPFAEAVERLVGAGLRPPAYGSQWVEALRGCGVLSDPAALCVIDDEGDTDHGQR